MFQNSENGKVIIKSSIKSQEENTMDCKKNDVNLVNSLDNLQSGNSG